MELYYPAGGRPKYYLVKDVAVEGKRRKVRKYLGLVQPSAEELEAYRREYGPWLEAQAVAAKSRITAERYRSRYLGDKLIALELVRHMNGAVRQHLSFSEISSYEQDFEIAYVQGTTSIEGNTLTRRQTADLLTEGIAPHSKSLREINEVQNFRQVIQYRRHYRGKVSADFVRTLHSMIMANIDFESTGQFRRIDDVAITGCDLKVTPSALIRSELEAGISSFYRRLKQGYHPFEEAVLFHYKFEMIHPFTDGNGRVGREILNYMLMRSKFPRLLFPGRNRKEYLDSLRAGNRDDFATLVLAFAQLMLSQRQEVLEERLRRVSVPRRKTGQLSLADFVSEN